MTEYVVERLAARFEQELEFDFIDISNEWTFVADDDYENKYIIQFSSKGLTKRKRILKRLI